MSDKFTVATFSDREKALAAKQRLEQAGIPADVFDESRRQRFWFMSRPLAGEKVQVRKADWERARTVLERAHPVERVLQGEVRCPDCGSVNVEYPQFTRKFLSTTLAELFCLVGVLEKQFYCEECHHGWGTKDQIPMKMDVLNWPVPRKAKGGMLP